ncbi:MAG: YjbQ family protein, partial [Rhodobacteraceae bacterium]|nr:YjbQ family protein [Paracoccaceae bacterium]
MKTIFRFQTNGPGLYEFTGEVASWVCQEPDGLLTLFIRHTSASLLIQENADPDVKWDLNAFFERLVPQ